MLISEHYLNNSMKSYANRISQFRPHDIYGLCENIAVIAGSQVNPS